MRVVRLAVGVRGVVGGSDEQSPTLSLVFWEEAFREGDHRRFDSGEAVGVDVVPFLRPTGRLECAVMVAAGRIRRG